VLEAAHAPLAGTAPSALSHHHATRIRRETPRAGPLARSLQFPRTEAQGGLPTERRRLSEKRRRFFFSKEATVSDVINDVVGMLIGLGPVGAALLRCDLQDRFRHRANRLPHNYELVVHRG
jgi:hypothetical protein